jgi:hypothetical protein
MVNVYYLFIQNGYLGLKENKWLTKSMYTFNYGPEITNT